MKAKLIDLVDDILMIHMNVMLYFLLKFLFLTKNVCVKVLRPSQPNKGHVEHSQFT